MNPTGEKSTASGEEIDESLLIEAVRRGDSAAFDGLVRRYMRRAWAVAYRLLQHHEDAEDLVQEAFLTALEKIDTFETGRPFGPWFFRILVNRGRNQLASRTRRATLPIPGDAASAAESPAREAERSELRSQIEAALEQLPERQRLIVKLFELEGFSGSEIAEMLDMPPGTVRWNLHQTRSRLRTLLAPLEEVQNNE